MHVHQDNQDPQEISELTLILSILGVSGLAVSSSIKLLDSNLLILGEPASEAFFTSFALASA